MSGVARHPDIRWLLGPWCPTWYFLVEGVGISCSRGRQVLRLLAQAYLILDLMVHLIDRGQPGEVQVRDGDPAGFTAEGEVTEASLTAHIATRPCFDHSLDGVTSVSPSEDLRRIFWSV